MISQFFHEDHYSSDDPWIQPTKTRLESGQSSTRRPQSTLISIIFFMKSFFFPDDTGIRTNEKTLRLTSIIVDTRVLLHQVSTYHQVLRCWITMHAQLRSVRLYITQHRSVAPCGAVRCGAVPFAAVLFRAALCAFFRTSSSTGYNACVVVYGVLLFLFFLLHVTLYLIFHGPLFFCPTQITPLLPIRTYNTGNKITQHS